MMHRSPITVVTGVAGGGFADADTPESYRRQEVGDAEARGRRAAHTAKTSSSLTREPPTRLSRRLDRSAERSRGWLAGEGSQRRNGHDQEYARSGMDPGDGGGLTGRDAQPYAAHISP